jgi:hypothetical protein
MLNQESACWLVFLFYIAAKKSLCMDVCLFSAMYNEYAMVAADAKIEYA